MLLRLAKHAGLGDDDHGRSVLVLRHIAPIKGLCTLVLGEASDAGAGDGGGGAGAVASTGQEIKEEVDDFLGKNATADMINRELGA